MTRTATTSASVDESTPFESPDETIVVEFPSGIPGFESDRRFFLMTSPELSPLGCLKAIDSDVSFLVIDPRLLSLDYDQTLNDVERVRLGATTEEPLLWLAIVTITENQATANLRAPVVINPAKMVGCQVIRETDRYPVEFVIHLG